MADKEAKVQWTNKDRKFGRIPNCSRSIAFDLLDWNHDLNLRNKLINLLKHY